MDDKEVLEQLSKNFQGKNIVILAPGRSLSEHSDNVMAELKKDNTISIAVNFSEGDYPIDYVFSSNMRRYNKIQGRTKAKCITTSNMKDCTHTDYMVNFASYASKSPEIIDNSGLMLLRLLMSIGVKEVAVAGMDGYSTYQSKDYFDKKLEYDFSKEAEFRNTLISEELKELRKSMKIRFITPSYYCL